eukprot:5879588-Pleurochrysis_carterae.AAC.3
MWQLQHVRSRPLAWRNRKKSSKAGVATTPCGGGRSGAAFDAASFSNNASNKAVQGANTYKAIFGKDMVTIGKRRRC